MNDVRITGRLQFSFAALTCLGGLMLASGSNNEIIPVIAIFFSIFGFLFVDWMRLFSLPPVAAYVGMGFAAVYCVVNFVDLDQPGNHQMISVSQLLVCVQAILMLQKKTIRIYEQLAVFCLLELVVAAVFNDALNYGLLLVPICIIGVWALTLLGIATSIGSIDNDFCRLLGGFDEGERDSADTKSVTSQKSLVQVHGCESSHAMSRLGIRLPNLVMLSFAPGAMIIAAFFFYALPRTTDAGRVGNQGMAVVGFNDQVRLEQLGRMGQNSQVAAKVSLKRRPGEEVYKPIAGLFLRGAVLESYRVDRFVKPSDDHVKNSSVWSAFDGGSFVANNLLPPEFFPAEFYPDPESNLVPDPVSVQVTYATSRSPSLFTIPPYHGVEIEGVKAEVVKAEGFEADRVQAVGVEPNANVIHRSDRWTLTRDGDRLFYPTITYSFGTFAFRGGVQCEAIVTGLTLDLMAIERRHQFDRADGSEIAESRLVEKRKLIAEANKHWAVYKEELLRFDPAAMPTIKSIANTTADRLNSRLNSRSNNGAGSESLNDYALAKSLEQYFSIDQQYQYSLNLNAESIVGMDPIEQFVSVDRVGHCQYFASALAMMLRSKGIPSRVIVGYKTNEYSEIGGYYVARQSHAHAWVEALIDRDDLDVRSISGGQPRSDQYWVRLDPTPSSFSSSEQPSQASQVIDLAQDIWNGLVIEMDAGRQSRAISGKRGASVLSQSYGKFVDRISSAVGEIRSGRLGGGSLANYNGFSWQAALFGIVICIAFLLTAVLWRSKHRSAAGRIVGRSGESRATRPSVDFYANAMDQLERLGIERADAETPNEVLSHSRLNHLSKPLGILTSAFYQARYSGENFSSSRSDASKLDVEQALEDLTRRVDAMRSGDNTAGPELPPK